MKGLIINIGAATILFAGALFGALFATGRLNHEGTANIPLLSMLFPEPAGAPQLLDPQGKPMDAVAKDAGKPADAVQASGSSQDPKPQDPKGNTATKLKKGRSLVATEAPKGGERVLPMASAAPNGETEADASHAAEQDFADRKQELARDRTTRYSPGGYFRFDGMPAGLTPEKLNEAWARVQEVTADLEKRGKALDLRDRDLKLLADDIQRRWTELGKERSEVEGLQAKVDERIERFKEQVKLVRTDEVAGLKRNAQTLASLEPEKVAELIQAQWISDGGQDEVLKTLEFMSKDKVNEILAVLPNAMIRDLLQKRLKVSKEPPAPHTASK
ncbi:MAG: hypothetical protein EXS02_07525 [Planctomycetes bacterium]|nr:hypothetical protein [Planctomycetota bacterium]